MTKWPSAKYYWVPSVTECQVWPSAKSDWVPIVTDYKVWLSAKCDRVPSVTDCQVWLSAKHHMKWNNFSHFQAPGQETLYTKCFSFVSRGSKLSKPNPNSTELNETQLNLKQLYVARVEVKHSSHLFHHHRHPSTNFLDTSIHARKLKIGTPTH